MTHAFKNYNFRTLIKLKTDDASVKFRREVNADWNHQIGQPPIPLVRWEAHTLEYLLSAYETLCEVWEIQGNKITPEFLRLVFQNDIRNRIKKNRDMLRNHPQVNHMPDEARKSYLGQIDYSAAGLEGALFRRIESDAIELEYRDKENLPPDEKHTSEKNWPISEKRAAEIAECNPKTIHRWAHRHDDFPVDWIERDGNKKWRIRHIHSEKALNIWLSKYEEFKKV